jgi:hypothetical protein
LDYEGKAFVKLMQTSAPLDGIILFAARPERPQQAIVG